MSIPVAPHPAGPAPGLAPAGWSEPGTQAGAGAGRPGLGCSSRPSPALCPGPPAVPALPPAPAGVPEAPLCCSNTAALPGGGVCNRPPGSFLPAPPWPSLLVACVTAAVPSVCPLWAGGAYLGLPLAVSPEASSPASRAPCPFSACSLVGAYVSFNLHLDERWAPPPRAERLPGLGPGPWRLWSAASALLPACTLTASASGG